jgi:hypothetical protein
VGQLHNSNSMKVPDGNVSLGICEVRGYDCNYAKPDTKVSPDGNVSLGICEVRGYDCNYAKPDTKVSHHGED